MMRLIKLACVAFIPLAAFASAAAAGVLLAPQPHGAGSIQLVGLKCGMEDGKFVCENKSSKKHDDDDEDEDDDHDKKKKKDDTSGLETCTIQSKNGGGGCTTPFKYVCEKMKSGKKCCGCVMDKKAKKEQEKKEAAKPKLFTCIGQVTLPGGGSTTGPTGPYQANSPAEAQAKFATTSAGAAMTPVGPITCTPVN